MVLLLKTIIMQGTSVQRIQCYRVVWLGEAFNMPSEPVDGRQETVHDAMQKAVDHCRNGNGPSARNARLPAINSMSDPAK